MKKQINITCEKTGKPCMLEYNIVVVTFADGKKIKKAGSWHCSERQANNINEDCTCNKTLSKINLD